jgi:pyruvate ferredoxin oxidoreductase delta subunit
MPSLTQTHKSWRDLPVGVVQPSGLSRLNKTGTWRVAKPILNTDKCTLCLLCWLFCPDAAIIPGEQRLHIDYDYCKGCGVCANECSVKAITMVAERAD